jgi:hypothetical protein
MSFIFFYFNGLDSQTCTHIELINSEIVNLV